MARRRIISTRIGCGLVLTLGALSAANAQGRGGNRPPYRHTANLHIIEKLTGKGNEILYELTAGDPDVLVEPWVMTPRILRLNQNPDAGLVPERAYCEVYEKDNSSSQIRH